MKRWAIIIGGSSGIGLATAKKMADTSHYVIIIHRDRRSVLPDLEAAINPYKEKIRTFNFDGVNPEKVESFMQELQEVLGEDKIDLMVHAISRGNLKPLISGNNDLSDQDLQLTLEAMSINLLTWSRALLKNDCFSANASIVSLTSAGSTRAWSGYAAVGMAKAAIENLSKYMAVEMASKGIRVNTIHAGITDTPSLRSIPGHEELMQKAAEINPSGRMTTPEDVANAIFLLTLPEAAWINGSLIHVDGGEHLTG